MFKKYDFVKVLENPLKAHRVFGDGLLEPGDVVQLYDAIGDRVYYQSDRFSTQEMPASCVEPFDLNMYAGQEVRVNRNGSRGVRPWNKEVKLVPGDLITIDRVDSNIKLYYSLDGGSENFVYYYDVSLVGKVELKKPVGECKCETLIFGHHIGCPYYKEL